MRKLELNAGHRCSRCRLPPRWCICAAEHPLDLPLQVDVIMHFREQHRPSSTGNLVHRLVRGANLHLWRAGPFGNTVSMARTRPECWILHPQGEPMPEGMAPSDVQVMLLDGSWSESSAMSRDMGALGRRVSLRMEGESRYWLRDQQDGGRFSTVEALLFLLTAMGLDAASEKLRLQFELHVYANLRARGQKARAEAFLQNSPVRDAFSDVLAQLHLRRPRVP